MQGQDTNVVYLESFGDLAGPQRSVIRKLADVVCWSFKPRSETRLSGLVLP